MKKLSLYELLFEDKDVDNKDATEGEIDVDASSPKARQSKDSVDDQIDGLILKYENSSIKEKEDALMESILYKKLSYLLLEQDEEEAAAEEPAAGEDAAAEEEGGGEPDPSGSEDVGVDAPAAKEEVPNLDIDNFTKRCVRLIINYRNLLKIEEAIVNRIKNFLDKHYGDAYVSEFLEILENQHGISISEFEDDILNSNEPDIPFAVGATASTGGGGG